MDDTVGTRDVLLEEPRTFKYTTDYVRRLLLERQFIYAKLTNPGGSVILTATGRVDHDRGTDYSSEIGSSFHLDLVELDEKLESMVADGSMSIKEYEALLSWADGMTSQQAAHFLYARGSVPDDLIRKRKSRGVRKLVEGMNGEGPEVQRMRNDGIVPVRGVQSADAGGQEAGDIPAEDGHTGSTDTTDDQVKGV